MTSGHRAKSGETHKAVCACGQLEMTVRGAPDLIIACNCLACQKRTGSAFGVGAYYARRHTEPARGKARQFDRTAKSGRGISAFFCPDCGTTVYWTLEMRPDHIGLALGCFGDPGFAGPARAIWTESRHHWVRFPDDMPLFEQAVPEG
jgi:hypothetical protein